MEQSDNQKTVVHIQCTEILNIDCKMKKLTHDFFFPLYCWTAICCNENIVMTDVNDFTTLYKHLKEHHCMCSVEKIKYKQFRKCIKITFTKKIPLI